MSDVTDWQTILNRYFPEFCQAAAEVGIDGAKLYQALPPSGQLVTGKRVPVLHSKYKGTCSFLFYINQTANGITWPYFKFMTFKHGGVSSVFNGWHHYHSMVNHGLTTSGPKVSPRMATIKETTHPKVSDTWRFETFCHDSYEFYRSPWALNCAWLRQRLAGYLTANLMERIVLRYSAAGYLLAPISHVEHGLVGYHKIEFVKKNQKRHHILHAGQLKGASILIEQNCTCPCTDIAICEGLVTGLSIALAWPGKIYVALSAGNLQAVRQSLPDDIKVTFFADNDAWKPEIGNIGVLKAQAAALPGDIILVPRFDPQFAIHKPTDFNDLLMLEGLASVIRQVER